MLELENKSVPFFAFAPGGGTRIVRTRNEAGVHDFGARKSQNRGFHFNDESGTL